MERYPFGSYFSGSDVIDLIGHRIKGQDSIESLKAAAKILDFENAAYIRDKIAKLKGEE